MLRNRPLLAAAFLLAALALACGGDNGDGDGADQTPDPTSAVTPTTTPAREPPSPTPSTLNHPTPKSFPERPEISIDPAATYIATVETTRGNFRIQLKPDIAIETVNSFVFLARQGFYDGVTFHRVIPGFVAQAGDPTGTGSGGPGYTLPAEFSNVPFVRGTVGLARGNEPDSGGSQFFVAYADAIYDDLDDSGDASVGDVRLRPVGPFADGTTLAEGSAVAEGDPDIGLDLTTVSGLDGRFTVFGEVIEGMNVVDSLTPRDPARDPAAPPGDTIITIKIEETG